MNTKFLLSKLKKLAQDTKSEIHGNIYLDSDKNSFCISSSNELEVHTGTKEEDFLYTRYSKFQKFVENMYIEDAPLSLKLIFVEEKNLNPDCLDDVSYNNFDSVYYDEYYDDCEDDNSVIICSEGSYGQPVQLDSFEIGERKTFWLKVNKEYCLRLFFTIDKDGKTYVTKEGAENNELPKELSEFKSFVDTFNMIIGLFDQSDTEPLSFTSPRSEDDILSLVKEDYKKVLSTNYFNEFLKPAKLIDTDISIYYKSKQPGNRPSESTLNVFHYGYFFNWNTYPDKKPQTSLALMHTFEDRSSITSTLSEDFHGRGNDKLDGRALRVIKETSDIDLLPVLASYFKGDNSELLLNRTTMKISLNKGLVRDMANNYYRYVGFNEEGEEVVSLKVADGDSYLKDRFNVKQFIEEVNELIADINS